jgi:hypothetical protein
MIGALVLLALGQALPLASSGGSVTDSNGDQVTTTQGIADDTRFRPTGVDADGIVLRPRHLDLRAYGERLDYVLSLSKGQLIRIQNPGGSTYTIYLSDALDFYLPTTNVVLWTAQSYWYQMTDLAVATCNAGSTGRMQRDAAATVPSYCNGTAWHRVPVSLFSTQTVDFSTVSSLACSESSITVTGATTGSVCAVSTSAALEAGISGPTCRVSASNTVQLRLCNITALGIDPASVDFQVQVSK